MRKKKIARVQKQEEEASLKELYETEVQEFCKKNSATLMDSFASLCESTNGRVSYEQLKEILVDFPKAPWLDRFNYPEQLKAVFRQIQIPFKAEDTHIYFP